MPELNVLKREVFFSLLDIAQRVFVHVKPSEHVVIGRRGLVESEVDEGIVLVFNPGMNFIWADDAIEATLVFGGNAEKCYVPASEILAIYSPDAGVQFIVSPDVKRSPKKKAAKKADSGVAAEDGGKIISVDFSKKPGPQG